MKIELQNIAGCESALLDVEGTVFLAGNNAAGKSSICLGIGLAASGESEKLNKTELAEIPRSGGGESFVEIKTEEGKIRASFPTGTIKKTGGWGAESSAYAVGLRSLPELPPKERASELIRILRAEPTKEEWIDALVEKGIDKGVATTVSNEIMKGAEKAYNYFCDHGKTMKGRFKEVTAMQWGSKQGGQWLLKNWSPTDDPKSVETMQSELSREKEILEGLISYKAVAEDEIKRCEEEAAGLDKAAAEAKSAAEEEKKAEKAYKEAASALQGLPRPAKEEKTTPCPHCDEPVVIRGATLSKPAEAVEQDLDKINDDIEAAQKKCAKLSDALQAAHSAAMRTQLAVSDAKRAQVRLEELKAEAARPRPEGDVEAQRIRIERLDNQIKGQEAKEKADKLHKSIMDNQLIIDVLAPDGLRQTKLAEAMEDLNNRLTELSSIANWKRVAVSDDMTITYGGKRYEGLATATSEKFRVRVTLQFALAQIQSSRLVVIDAADVMDAKGRGGLFSLLKATGVDAVISMTYNEITQIEEIARALPHVKAYWLEGATARQVGKAVAA